MTDPSDPLFLFGPGYSAQALARLWSGPIFGSVRPSSNRAGLDALEIQPISISDEGAIREAVRGAHLVVSAPPSETGCPALNTIGADAAKTLASVTYLSTTGVYGDRKGGWVAEWTEPRPDKDRAKRRRAAELDWQKTVPDARLVRLPGIYGPGRSAFDRLRSGRAQRIVKPGQVFSRIHVDDIADGVKALILADTNGVFHLCDDLAAPPQDVISYAAKLIGVDPGPLIPFEAADLSDMARSFYSECKRVTNARAKAASGWRPRYTTYKDGLSAILAVETGA